MILYLHSERRARFSPLWADWRNFLTPSTEPELLLSCTFFFFWLYYARKSAASSPTRNKHRLHFDARARRGEPSRPFICLSYLFIPDCKFMRILLSFFQLWLLPPRLDEEKEPRPSLGLEVFLLSPHNWLSMCGEENLNYSACEAMAPPMELGPNAHVLFFSVISTWSCQEEKKTIPHTTLFSLKHTAFHRGVQKCAGAPEGIQTWPLGWQEMHWFTHKQ